MAKRCCRRRRQPIRRAIDQRFVEVRRHSDGLKFTKEIKVKRDPQAFFYYASGPIPFQQLPLNAAMSDSCTLSASISGCSRAEQRSRSDERSRRLHLHLNLSPPPRNIQWAHMDQSSAQDCGEAGERAESSSIQKSLHRSHERSRTAVLQSWLSRCHPNRSLRHASTAGR